jgi:hypothetical protein
VLRGHPTVRWRAWLEISSEVKTRPVLNCRLENVVVDEPPLHQLAFNQSDHAGSFCDPEPKARKEMGYVEGSDLALQIALRSSQDLSSAEVSDRRFAIEVTKYWPLRETFWFDQLSDSKNRDLIFVSGDARGPRHFHRDR